jgi:RNase P/RNase MRP subunit p29
MLYSTALSVAEHAVHALQGNEGRMSDEEQMVAVYALTHALKVIAKHNSLEDLEDTLDE